MMQKKYVSIAGSLLRLLEEGRPALILFKGAVIRTSPVVEILQQAEDYAEFETMNTVYRVVLETERARAATGLCA